MHIAVVGGAGLCIQQWWVGLDHAFSSGGWDWTMHSAVVGGAGPCIQQWWVELNYASSSGCGAGLCIQLNPSQLN